MLNPWMKILIGFVLLTTLSACSGGTAFHSARVTNSTTGITSSSNSCGNTTQTTGRVYDDGGSSGYSFEQRVKGLLAASVDPQYFGTISGDANNTATGVSFEGRLSVDSIGNVNLSQSNLKLTVTDSYVGQKDSEGKLVSAYPMNFSAANSGTVNLATKTFTLVFKDSYGEINLTGSFNGAITTGTINYSNYSNVVSGNFPTSATLGTFKVSTCAFVNE